MSAETIAARTLCGDRHDESQTISKRPNIFLKTDQTRRERSRITGDKSEVPRKLNRISAPANSALCSSANDEPPDGEARYAMQVVSVSMGRRTRDRTKRSTMFRGSKVHRAGWKLFKLQSPLYPNLIALVCVAALLQLFHSSDRSPSAWPPQADCATNPLHRPPGSESSPRKVAPASNRSITATTISIDDSTTHNPKKSGQSTRSGPQAVVIKAASLPPSLISSPRQSWSGKRLTSSASYQEQSSDQSRQQQLQQQQQRSAAAGDLQLSITPRVSLVRVPVESNAILKCLISSQSVNKFTKKFDIHWSRYMYDENVYEQIESFGQSDRSTESSSPESSTSAGELEARRTSAEQADMISLAANQEDRSVLFNRQQQLRDFLDRARQETNSISDLLIEATLSISPVKATDNATYYCTATDGLSEQSQARIDLVALSRPVVLLQRVQPARDSKSALIYWLVAGDGNTPIKRTILMVRNDTNAMHQSGGQQSGATDQEQQQFSPSVVLDSDYNQWQRIDIAGDGDEPSRLYSSPSSMPASPYGGDLGGDSVVRADLDITSSAASSGRSSSIQSNQPEEAEGSHGARRRWRHGRLNKGQRSYNLTGLLPGVTYNFRLAAINDMGQSNWTYLTSTMPNEIPAQIGEVFLLLRQNDSLAIGWRRPIWDNAKTIRYEMQLFDLNRTLTLDANTNMTTGSSAQTKFMYIFVNLNPGTDYHFHVRACSRAGCSAFSAPKLLASTLDGEPDEPLDVELTCRFSTEEGINNVSVTWLPPVNTRGQLLNYSVAFDSYARYRNQSALWKVDEWRSSMETSDNHTISLETRGTLQPNTNYTVRVCANNRSKQCGRLSLLSARTQCSTLPELPSQLPADIRLTVSRPETYQRTNMGSDTQSGSQRIPNDSLLLELPFISQRNGTIDCIQVVLIRLPKSFNNGSLSQILPEEARDLKLSTISDLREIEASKTSDQVESASAKNQRPIAYVAEEVDQTNWWPPASFNSNQAAMQQVVLGDGYSRLACPDLPSTSAANMHPKRQVYDAQLAPQTYYTGFIKLVLVRKRYAPESRNGRFADPHPEVLVKYSNYFDPVLTGETVPEVTPNDQVIGEELNATSSVNPFHYGNSPMSLQEMATRLGIQVRSSLSKLYNSSSAFVVDNIRLEALSTFITQSSPLMQVLELGILVLLGSLFILFVIYIVTLPNAARRKRTRKMKRQLQKHQEASARNNEAAYLAEMGCERKSEPVPVESSPGDADFAQNVDYELAQSGQQQVPLPSGPVYQQAEADIAQHQNHHHHDQHHHRQQQQIQQHENPNGYKAGRAHQECPIHSSPLASKHSPAHYNAENQAYGHHHVHHHHQQQQQQQQARSSVNVCNNQQPGHNHSVYSAAVQEVSAYKQRAGYQQQPHLVANPAQMNHANHEQHYERNCRTTRRGQAGHQAHYAAGANHLMDAELGSETVKNHLTLSNQNSVLALAKKINKSIPLRVFGAVFECRLRNNWLREEYEQLPRPQLWPPATSGGFNGNGRSAQLLIKLRSQLIVSRNDSVSALISGNELFDASCVSLTLPLGFNGPAEREKSIICAKSPLDADSVWDFWRLVYEQEVSTIVMLTQNEDPNTGELRCAQYWPTCDNEETTILSPCNEYVQKSSILPAKFKIRQETLSEDGDENFKVRQLTLIVMATKPGENEPAEDGQQSEGAAHSDNEQARGATDPEKDEDEESLIIVERTILHLQFCCWNTSSLANQMRLIKFIEKANERHLKTLQALLESPGSTSQANNPMLVHCSNGLGRSGLFTAMSFVIEDLSLKLGFELQQGQPVEQQHLQRLNLFQLVARMRAQREMLLSPYRLYELLYQLTTNCIPMQERPLPLLLPIQQSRQPQQVNENHHQH